MEKVTIEDVESLSPPDESIPDGMMADSIGSVRELSEALDATGVAINHYELAPGESFTASAHSHGNQEELFYAQSGTVTFETETDDVTVEAGEILRIPPGTRQLGTNRGDEQVTALVLGAPREYEEGGQWMLDCDDCGEYTAHDLDELEAEQREIYRCAECESVFK